MSGNELTPSSSMRTVKGKNSRIGLYMLLVLDKLVQKSWTSLIHQLQLLGDPSSMQAQDELRTYSPERKKQGSLS